jgi:hypothetical protein
MITKRKIKNNEAGKLSKRKRLSEIFDIALWKQWFSQKVQLLRSIIKKSRVYKFITQPMPSEKPIKKPIKKPAAKKKKTAKATKK